MVSYIVKSPTCVGTLQVVWLAIMTVVLRRRLNSWLIRAVCFPHSTHRSSGSILLMLMHKLLFMTWKKMKSKVVYLTVLIIVSIVVISLLYWLAVKYRDMISAFFWSLSFLTLIVLSMFWWTGEKNETQIGQYVSLLIVMMLPMFVLLLVLSLLLCNNKLKFWPAVIISLFAWAVVAALTYYLVKRYEQNHPVPWKFE